MESSKNDQNVPAIDIPIWQYDEMKHPGEDFDAEAGVYDERQLKTRDVKGEINECLDLLNLQPDQTVLDMGTGTGEFAIAAAGYCSKVFAVDLSPGMLKIADAKARIKGIKNIEFVQAGFLTYEHSGEPVDVAVSQFTLHYLPDFWKQIALLRLSRMMKKEPSSCWKIQPMHSISQNMRRYSIKVHPISSIQWERMMLLLSSPTLGTNTVPLIGSWKA
jgi:ubiquinone/menaquinone biosynthesis C-methylase UbiE